MSGDLRVALQGQREKGNADCFYWESGPHADDSGYLHVPAALHVLLIPCICVLFSPPAHVLDFRRTLRLQGLELKELEDSLRASARQLKMKQKLIFYQENQLIHKERPQ